MMLCAAVGGPVATICYVIGLGSATASGNPGVIVPIAALNCAIGALLGRVFFKQELGAHKVIGILVCLCAGALIGGASFASAGPEALVRRLFAFIAVSCWGFEGCLAGFGTIFTDYRIGIAIRQVTSGIPHAVRGVPAAGAGGRRAGHRRAAGGGRAPQPALLIFAVSGFFAMPTFSSWYKGSFMCGAALGMAHNGMYAFWGRSSFGWLWVF